MTMNPKAIMYALFCTCVLSSAGHAGVWTLERTVETALRESNRVAVERLEADEAFLDARTAESGILPTLSFSAGANYISEVMKIDLPFKSVRFGDYDSYDMSVSMNQLLYDGGRLKALKKANEEQSAMNIHEAESEARAVEFQAKAVFFTLVMAEQSRLAAEESLAEAQNHLGDVEALHGQGMALEIDVLKARLRVSHAEMELYERTAAIEKAKAGFRKIAGCAPDDEVEIVWDNRGHDQVPVKNHGNAFSTLPEFMALDTAIRAAENRTRVVSADMKPQVGLFGKYSYGKPGLDLPKNEWMDYFSGGIQVKYNLWDWGKNRRESEKALIAALKLKKVRDDLKRAIAQQITEAYADYDEAVKRTELAAESERLARRQLEMASVSYREGASTETDYDNAHASFTRSIYESTMANAALWISMAKIDYIMGIRSAGGNHE